MPKAFPIALTSVAESKLVVQEQHKATWIVRNWHFFPRVAILLRELRSSCFWATQTPWFFPKNNSFLFSQKAKSLSQIKGTFFLYGIFAFDGTPEQLCLFISPHWQLPKAQTRPPVRVCRKRDVTYIFCDIQWQEINEHFRPSATFNAGSQEKSKTCIQTPYFNSHSRWIRKRP